MFSGKSCSRSCLLILQLGWLSIFTGCGGGLPVATSPVVGNARNLSGNWLLAGTLPKAIGSSSNQAGLGITFDAIGNSVLAAAAISTTCSNSSAPITLRLGSAISGSVASDGSFTVTSLQSPSLPSLTISGKAPTTAGGTWSGTYTLTSSNNLCLINQTGPFTATAVQDLNGTYTGMGSVFGRPVSAPLGISLTLQQGAPLVSPTSTTSISSRLGIAGSIQVQGFSCFSKGTISTVSPSGVEGGPVLMNFTMDDGSTMVVLGSIDDVAASQLDINILEVTGGSCSGLYSFGSNVLVAKH